MTQSFANPSSLYGLVVAFTRYVVQAMITTKVLMRIEWCTLEESPVIPLVETATILPSLPMADAAVPNDIHHHDSMRLLLEFLAPLRLMAAILRTHLLAPSVVNSLIESRVMLLHIATRVYPLLWARHGLLVVAPGVEHIAALNMENHIMAGRC